MKPETPLTIGPAPFMISATASARPGSASARMVASLRVSGLPRRLDPRTYSYPWDGTLTIRIVPAGVSEAGTWTMMLIGIAAV
jgi:hypothetical protein